MYNVTCNILHVNHIFYMQPTAHVRNQQPTIFSNLISGPGGMRETLTIISSNLSRVTNSRGFASSVVSLSEGSTRNNQPDATGQQHQNRIQTGQTNQIRRCFAGIIATTIRWVTDL